MAETQVIIDPGGSGDYTGFATALADKGVGYTDDPVTES